MSLGPLYEISDSASFGHEALVFFRIGRHGVGCRDFLLPIFSSKGLLMYNLPSDGPRR